MQQLAILCAGERQVGEMYLLFGNVGSGKSVFRCVEFDNLARVHILLLFQFLMAVS